MNWKDIPLPERMRDLPKDARGFPVPFIILRDPSGIPLFTANDSTRVEMCAQHKICGVCGKALMDDMWMLGGPKSAFHARGAYVDSPIHYECGRYALQVCPYLAYRSYRGKVDVEALSDRFQGTVLFHDPTQDDQRPPFFVFGKTSGYSRTPQRFIVPNRPFLQTEFWDAGEQITEEAAFAKIAT